MAHATTMYAHAVEYCACTMFSRISRPTPTIYSAKYSLTMALITAFGVLTFNAVKFKNAPAFLLRGARHAIA